MNHETLHKNLNTALHEKHGLTSRIGPTSTWPINKFFLLHQITICKFHFERHPTRSPPVTSETKRSSPENSETHLLSTLSGTLTWFQLKFNKSKKNQS